MLQMLEVRALNEQTLIQQTVKKQIDGPSRVSDFLSPRHLSMVEPAIPLPKAIFRLHSTLKAVFIRINGNPFSPFAKFNIQGNSQREPRIVRLPLLNNFLFPNCSCIVCLVHSR